MHKKGQAAMEFLMTYGWAILAAIIAIGVLAYFGVFNPARLAGSTGIVNAPFNMDAFSIVSDSTVGDECGVGVLDYDCITMEITQSSGKTIDVFSLTDIITAKQGVGGTPIWVCLLTPTIATSTWTTGEKRTLACHTTTTDAWVTTDAISVDVTFAYEVTNSNIAQTSSGTVRGTSQ